MKFSKMHGLGNDYVYVDAAAEHVPDPAATARLVSDRHTGIGSDGLILVTKPAQGSGAHVGMRMFNADGSEAQMCGNGIRCVTKFAVDRGLASANPLRVETRAGTLEMRWTAGADGRVAEVEVDMGAPKIDEVAAEWNADAWRDALARRSCVLGSGWIAETGLAPGATVVSMGNPHIVFWVKRVARVPLESVGPAIECHAKFPDRINVHCVEVISRGEVRMRTWERGSGITQACGTGACAVCVAGVAEDRTDRSLLAHLPGGDLHLRWDAGDGRVRMRGPATHVFDGEWTA